MTSKLAGRGVVSEQLTQAGQRLYLSQARGRYIGLKLQQLQLDLEKIGFADVASVVLGIGDVNGLLEVLQILLRKLQA